MLTTRSRGVLEKLARQAATTGFCSGVRFYEDPYRRLIGNREIVGHGINSLPSYIDETAFPFPAIRYCECTPELMAMREKERGDWRKLTINEKKYLYRASFRQTFAEMNAPSTEWKSIVGSLLIGISIACWFYLFIHKYIHREGPKSFSPESRIAQYYRLVEINNQPITGNYRPPGAELRVHPKNKEMLKKITENSTKQH